MAAMLGAVPLAIGMGTGSELRQPLGIAIVGGLIVSQALTLFTTPVVYLSFEHIRMTRPANAPLRVFRHSGFGFHSSFVIRHLTICASQESLPNSIFSENGMRRAQLLEAANRQRTSSSTSFTDTSAIGAAPWFLPRGS